MAEGPAAVQFGYQYAVIARSYCLLAPVLFATAIFYRSRATSYWRFALCVLLLSHISLHATLMAGAIWLFEVTALIRPSQADSTVPARMRMIWLGILSVNFLLIIWQLWPPADLWVRPPYEFDQSRQIFLNALKEAYSLPGGLAFLFLLALLPLLYVRRTLGLFLLGLGFPLVLMCFRYYAIWHTGTQWFSRSSPHGSRWIAPIRSSAEFPGSLHWPQRG